MADIETTERPAVRVEYHLNVADIETTKRLAVGVGYHLNATDIELFIRLREIAQFLLQPRGHCLAEFQQQLRQRDVRLVIERLEQRGRLGVHRRITASLAATQTFHITDTTITITITTTTTTGYVWMSQLTVKPFSWIKPRHKHR